LTTIIQNTHSKRDIPQPIINELDRITKLRIEQNFFHHNNNLFYKQNEGLAMGAPSSSITGVGNLRPDL
jgi:hypothetical protein